MDLGHPSLGGHEVVPLCVCVCACRGRKVGSLFIERSGVIRYPTEGGRGGARVFRGISGYFRLFQVISGYFGLFTVFTVFKVYRVA